MPSSSIEIISAKHLVGLHKPHQPQRYLFYNRRRCTKATPIAIVKFYIQSIDSFYDRRRCTKATPIIIIYLYSIDSFCNRRRCTKATPIIESFYIRFNKLKQPYQVQCAYARVTHEKNILADLHDG